MSDNDRIPSITELFNRAAEASRNRWREAPAAARQDTMLPPAPGFVREARPDEGVRTDAPDVRAIPKVSDLQARYEAAARVAWKTNPGDGVRALVTK
jgi:hypothetical protein